uniref:Putative secreted protein n=1 Tax=Ixodes ricinus TaxID=34613 RepID=A0A6B0VAE5_IXORI
MLWLLRDMLRLLHDMLWLLLLLLRSKVLLLKLSMGLLHLLLVVKLLLLGIVELLLLLLLVVQLLLLNVWVASLSHGRRVWNTLVLHALLRMWLVLRMTALLRVVLGCLPVVLLLGWRGTAVVLRRLQLVGMVPVGAVALLLHVVHLLHLELTLVLLVCPQLVLGVDLLLVQALPAIVPLEVLPLRHVHELLVADHAVLVLVTLVNDVLSHALNLLLPLPGIVFLIVGVIDFLHLGSQDGFDLVLIQLPVPVQIVHGKECVGIEILLVHVVLFLPGLLQLRLAPRFVHGRVVLVLPLKLLVVLLLLLLLLLRHVLQLVPVLQLLLHLILLELLLALLVQLLQVLGRRHNQLLQIINLEAVGILIVDMKGHLHLIPIQAKLLSLHGFHGQPT